MKIESLREVPVYEPIVTFIVPTWRDSKVLQQCLENIARLDYPSDKIEVILISKNGISLDPEIRLTIKILKVDELYNHAQMRNKAVQISKGAILAFIDDDVLVKPDWLRNGLKYFLFFPKIGCIGGPGVAVENLTFPGKCSYYTLASPFSSGFSFMRYYNTGRIYETGENDLILCNNMIRRSAFIETGGFDSRQVPCEENDLYRKLIEANWRLFYIPDIEAIHHVKPPHVTITKGFWYGIGRGSFVVRKLKCNLKPRIFIPSLSLIFICSFGILSFFYSLPRYMLAGYLLLYTFNMIQHLIFVFRKFSKNLFFWFILPPITFLFHHAYGLGVIIGIFRSSFFNKKESKMNEYFRKY